MPYLQRQFQDIHLCSRRDFTGFMKHADEATGRLISWSTWILTGTSLSFLANVCRPFRHMGRKYCRRRIRCDSTIVSSLEDAMLGYHGGHHDWHGFMDASRAMMVVCWSEEEAFQIRLTRNLKTLIQISWSKTISHFLNKIAISTCVSRWCSSGLDRAGWWQIGRLEGWRYDQEQ